MTTDALPVFADVQAAAQRLQGWAHRTPVLRSRTADALLGAEVFFKCENLQRAGAFKFRGAFNALSQFTAAKAATWTTIVTLAARRPRTATRTGRRCRC